MLLHASTRFTFTRECVPSKGLYREAQTDQIRNTDIFLIAPWRHIQEAGTTSRQGDQGVRNKGNGTKYTDLGLSRKSYSYRGGLNG